MSVIRSKMATRSTRGRQLRRTLRRTAMFDLVSWPERSAKLFWRNSERTRAGPAPPRPWRVCSSRKETYCLALKVTTAVMLGYTTTIASVSLYWFERSVKS